MVVGVKFVQADPQDGAARYRIDLLLGFLTGIAVKGLMITTRHVHPGSLTWNLRIHPGKGKSYSQPSFSGSMLIFGGVCE